MSLSLLVVLDNKDRHSEATLAASDLVDTMLLNESFSLSFSTRLPHITDGATWNLAGCLRGGQLLAHLIRQAMEGTIFPFEIWNNYSPSSGLGEY